MSDVQVKTITGISREHTIPEADFIALFKLDVSNGGVITLVHKVADTILVVITEPPQSADSIIVVTDPIA